MNSYDKKITIKDIAKASGVSVTTVSRYLNGQTHLMSSETCSRIKYIIEISGYRPNLMARNLRSKQSTLVAVILARMSSPTTSALMHGIEEVLFQNNLIPIYMDCGGSKSREDSLIDNAVLMGVSGFIVLPCDISSSRLVELDLNNIPVVLCSKLITDHTFNAVISESPKVIFELVRHYFDNGFDPPLYFTPGVVNSSVRANKCDLFIDALSDIYNVSDPLEYIRYIDENHYDTLYSYLNDILSAETRRIPIIAGNSGLTVDIYSWIKRNGLKMPDQIAFSGYYTGDPHIFPMASLTTPTLTTVETDFIKMGKAAASLLIESLASPKLDKRVIQVDSFLIKRESTLPCK